MFWEVPIKLLVGLGNPGPQYATTRHNIGFMVVEDLALQQGWKISKKSFSSLWDKVGGKGNLEGVEILVQFPQTYMNLSGQAVRELKEYYRILDQDVLVVHDELDLDVGRVKKDFGAGAAGHRGVSSMIQELGTKNFHRIRMGIGRPIKKEEVEGYVLSPFSKTEEESRNRMIDEACCLIKDWVKI